MNCNQVPQSPRKNSAAQQTSVPSKRTRRSFYPQMEHTISKKSGCKAKLEFSGGDTSARLALPKMDAPCVAVYFTKAITSVPGRSNSMVLNPQENPPSDEFVFKVPDIPKRKASTSVSARSNSIVLNPEENPPSDEFVFKVPDIPKRKMITSGPIRSNMIELNQHERHPSEEFVVKVPDILKRKAIASVFTRSNLIGLNQRPPDDFVFKIPDIPKRKRVARKPAITPEELTNVQQHSIQQEQLSVTLPSNLSFPYERDNVYSDSSDNDGGDDQNGSYKDDGHQGNGISQVDHDYVKQHKLESYSMDKTRSETASSLSVYYPTLAKLLQNPNYRYIEERSTEFSQNDAEAETEISEPSCPDYIFEDEVEASVAPELNSQALNSPELDEMSTE